MDESEILVFVASLFISVVFVYKWYWPILSVWPHNRGMAGRNALMLLPIVSQTVIFFTLKTLASFDVVDSPIYIIFYMLLGFSWFFIAKFIITVLFDISPIDDIVIMRNKAALIAFIGGFLGLTAVYSASNIGDGPGWWCVVFAGALGTVAWTALAVVAGRISHVFERITVDRDIPGGIRLGCYLLADGIILGRASAGDWTSFSMTIVEFLDGWPAIPLTVLMVIIERYAINSAKDKMNGSGIAEAVFAGLLFVALALLSVLLLPALPINPIYRGV